MTKLAAVALAAALSVGVAATAAAHHREGHPTPPGHQDRGDFFPGSPSGKFFLEPIAAGATCTATIVEPDGQDATAHGGPPKRGFAKPEDLELVVLSEDPDTVQFCWLDGETRLGDHQVRVSFQPEPEEVEAE